MKSFLGILCLCFSFSLSAQDFYIDVKMGFGQAISAGQAGYYYRGSFFNDQDEFITDGFGEGLYLKSNFGYNYNSFLAFEFGFNFLKGQTVEFTHRSAFFATSGIPGGGFYNHSQSINAFLFSPQLVFNVPNQSKIQPYAKVGIAISPFIKSTVDAELNELDSNDVYIKTIMKGGTPLGFTASLGARYSISKRLAIVADFDLLNMTYRPYKSVITEYIVDGDNRYENLSISQRETLYISKRESNGTPNDINKPRELFPIMLPMSNINFNLGLQFNL
ncbi:MAG: outer membrane beta-barrel protein [Saprospiraceae bacterium]